MYLKSSCIWHPVRIELINNDDNHACEPLHLGRDKFLPFSLSDTIYCHTGELIFERGIFPLEWINWIIIIYSLVYLYYKDSSMRHPLRIEHSINGLLI